MQATDNNTSNWLRVILSAFFSRMSTVLLATFVCAAIAGASSYLLPKIYTGSFSIIVKAPEIDQSVIGDNEDVTVRPGTVGGNVITDEYHILVSEGLAHAVAEAYGASTPLPKSYLRAALSQWLPSWSTGKTGMSSAEQIDRLASYFQRQLVVTPALKSDIIKIRMDHHDRDFLKKILQLFATEYFQYRKTIWFTKEARGFFGDQADKSLTEWQNLTEERLRLKSQFQKIDPALEKHELQERISLNLSRLQALRLQLDQRNEQLRTLEALAPEDAITFFNGETRDNRLFWQLKIDIGEAKAKRQELLKDHLNKSPLIRKADLQLRGLYADYKNLTKSLINNSISMLQTEYDALAKNNQTNSERVLELERQMQQVDVIDKKIKLFERQYEVYQNKAITTETQNQSRNALGTAVRIMSPPMVRTTPIWPNRLALVVVAAILGFFLTLVAVVTMWVMKDSYRFPEDVTGYLGLPVLTSFSLEQEPEDMDPKPDSPGAASLAPPRRPSISFPNARAFGYSLLVFISMMTAGWVIGTTLWPVWKEHRASNPTPLMQELAGKAQRLIAAVEELSLGSGTTQPGGTRPAPLPAPEVVQVDGQNVRSQGSGSTQLGGTRPAPSPAPEMVQINGQNARSPHARARARADEVTKARLPQLVEVAPDVRDRKDYRTTVTDPVAGELRASDTAERAPRHPAEPKQGEQLTVRHLPALPPVKLAVFGVTPPPAEEPRTASRSKTSPGMPVNEPARRAADATRSGPAPTGTERASPANHPEIPVHRPDAVPNLAVKKPAGPRSGDKALVPARSQATPQTARSGPPQYFVQFGSFREQARALALKNRLANRGYVVRVPSVASKHSRDRWYSVRADFDDLATARKVRDDYQAREGIRPVLGKQTR